MSKENKMTFEVNHRVGSDVWIMRDNKPFKFKILKIEVEIDRFERVFVRYMEENNDQRTAHLCKYMAHFDTSCFSSQRELLDSLITE